MSWSPCCWLQVGKSWQVLCMLWGHGNIKSPGLALHLKPSSLLHSAGSAPQQAGPSRRPSNSSMTSEQTTTMKAKKAKRNAAHFPDENDENGVVDRMAIDSMPHGNSVRNMLHDEQPKKRAKVMAAGTASQHVLGQHNANAHAPLQPQQQLGRPPLAPRAGAQPVPGSQQQMGQQLLLQEEGPTHTESGMLRAARKIGLPGHLKSIHLENFMCHQNFQMEFGCVPGGKRRPNAVQS